MIIYVKNKHTLKVDDFKFKCCVGKKGISRKKIEGDLKTPMGIFKLGPLFFREDKIKKPVTNLKSIKIKKKMGWCNDLKSKKFYNKLISTRQNLKHEKLFRKDYKYNLFIPIFYNYKKNILGKGSCIFLHLTKNYKPTAGCIAIKENDFFILLRLINHKTKIKIT
tara:strand:+ start:803 stop:1297 length:495 start_codon:yes stop_codon:yes gene_type:complete